MITERTRKKDCRDCGKVFDLPTTRGRPPVKCEPCRGVKAAHPIITAAPIPKPKGNHGLYSRAALVSYLEENPIPIRAHDVAKLLRSLNES